MFTQHRLAHQWQWRWSNAIYTSLYFNFFSSILFVCLFYWFVHIRSSIMCGWKAVVNARACMCVCVWPREIDRSGKWYYIDPRQLYRNPHCELISWHIHTQQQQIVKIHLSLFGPSQPTEKIDAPQIRTIMNQLQCRRNRKIDERSDARVSLAFIKCRLELASRGSQLSETENPMNSSSPQQSRTHTGLSL